MMFGKIGVLALAAAICSGFCGMAQAGEGKGDGPGRYMEQLNDTQREQARSIFEEARNANSELRGMIRAKRAQLAEMMKSANPDVAAIEALCKEIGQLRGNELVARLETGEKLKQAGLPEMKRPERPEKNPDLKKGNPEEFAAKRLERLPEEKRAEAKRLFDENRAATSRIREELKAKRIDLEKAMDNGDTTNVALLSASLGELKGKLLAARIELRQNLAKAGLPPDTFDRGDKKDKAGKGHGKRGDKRDKREKRGE